MIQKEELLSSLGKRVAHLRIKAKMTQEELAYKCGKDQQSVQRLEKGRVNPSIYFLYEVADALGVPVKDLIEF